MKYFGTDGIRGRAEIFTKELVSSIAYAAAKGSCKIVIARDTRVSGKRIERLLSDSLQALGVATVCIGIVPTPVLAFFTRFSSADYGVMITASHNPPEYNGIKFFSSDGGKLTEEAEQRLENLIDKNMATKSVRQREQTCFASKLSINEQNNTTAQWQAAAINAYIAHVKASLNPDIKGLKILLDTANGAMAKVAPLAFREFGAVVSVINGDMDGLRINEDCGATHPEMLINSMSCEYDIGFTYDGDGDRVMAVKGGRLLDGDRLLYAVARYFQEQGKLETSAAVGTVMTNLGAEQAFEKRGIRFIRANVGDKNVAKEMLKHNCCIGGEASGHLIFSDYQNTGDGLLSSLLVAEIDKNRGLLNLDDIIEYPQVSNDIVTTKERIIKFESNKEIEDFIKSVSASDVRTVVRVSGTEPRIRIMAEAASRERAANLAADIKKYILMRI